MIVDDVPLQDLFLRVSQQKEEKGVHHLNRGTQALEPLLHHSWVHVLGCEFRGLEQRDDAKWGEVLCWSVVNENLHHLYNNLQSSNKYFHIRKDPCQ